MAILVIGAPVGVAGVVGFIVWDSHAKSRRAQELAHARQTADDAVVIAKGLIDRQAYDDAIATITSVLKPIETTDAINTRDLETKTQLTSLLRTANEAKEAFLEAQSRQRADRHRRNQREIKIVEATIADCDEAERRYPAYQASAREINEELLKIVSALEASITISEYRTRLQDLTYRYNKFSLQLNDCEKKHPSFRVIELCVQSLNKAGSLWNDELKGALNGDSKLTQDIREAERQMLWGGVLEGNAKLSVALKGDGDLKVLRATSLSAKARLKELQADN